MTLPKKNLTPAPIKPKPQPDPLQECWVSDPLNVRQTFLELTAQTCPSGYEAERFGSWLEHDGWQEDGQGNWYKVVGDAPTTAFTSHLDDVSWVRQNVVYGFQKGDILTTNGASILGADCKSGVAIMLYMIAAGVTGLYVLFSEEEVGRVGSEAAAKYGSLPLEGVTKMVSFDRKGTRSVITKQLSDSCCSNEFASALCDQLDDVFGFEAWMPDPTGSYTDSASFMGLIPECTNVSIGYQGAHCTTESQDMSFLVDMAHACSVIDWESLPVKRDPKARTIRPAWDKDWSKWENAWEPEIIDASSLPALIEAGDWQGVIDMVEADPYLGADIIIRLAELAPQLVITAAKEIAAYYK